VATHLPPEEIEGIRQMFMDMDRDGSGTISYMELKEGERRALHCSTCKTGTCRHSMAHCNSSAATSVWHSMC